MKSFMIDKQPSADFVSVRSKPDRHGGHFSGTGAFGRDGQGRKRPVFRENGVILPFVARRGGKFYDLLTVAKASFTSGEYRG
jgi:hypothetical protein